MKHTVFSFLLFMVVFSVTACSDSDSAKLVNKWQLRRYELADGTVKEIDNVFYNFQKGSFSAICLHTDGEYYTFFGLYTLTDDALSISIKGIEEPERDIYNTYLGWEEDKQVFTIEKLTSSQLVLQYSDNLLVFRKY